MNAPIRSLLALFAGLSALTSSALVHADALQISLWPQHPVAGEPFRIELKGEWPKACAPSVASSWVDGREVVLQLREGAKGCKADAAETLTLRSAEAGESQLVAGESGVYRVRVLIGQPERTLAFALAEVGEVDRVRPESGLWWPERGGEFETSGPGLGAQVEMQGDLLALNVSGYGDNGRPTWWFAANALDGPSQSMELTALDGGSGPFADYAAPEQVVAAGSIHIEWLGSGRAVFWFVRPDAEGSGLDVRPVSMTRFLFGPRPGEGWRGQWVMLAKAADGSERSQLLRFTEAIGRDYGFDLQADDGSSLSCELASSRPDSPPARCRLQTEDAGAIDFASVGLNRMEGRSAAGDEQVTLLKLQ